MHRITATASILLLLAGALSACEPPRVDDPGTGSSPEATGLMRGTVLYIGPRPECVYDGETAQAVRGNFVLLLFFSDNEPPPGGSATSAENLLVLPATEAFDLSDCMPAEPTPEDLATPLMRSVEFSWPSIALAEGDVNATVDYQIRGFLDRDDDFNPFFSVRRLTTKGDVAGGAFESLNANPPHFERITFGSAAANPNGEVVQGVSVALAATVNTELPAFELISPTRAILSSETVPATTDAAAREAGIFAMTEMEIRLIDPTEESWARTLAAAGMTIDPHPSGYSWFSFPVDTDRDGLQDFHPVLGSAGVLWGHPVVIMRRARNPIELAVGIPDTLNIATTRPTQTLMKDTFSPSIQIGVAPIAAVNINPALDICNIPYVPPGNILETLERIPVDCQEMPTGNYDVNVLSGLAGGNAFDLRAQLLEDMPGLPTSVLDAIVGGRTDTDWVIEDGSYSSQAWSIPNELGCPDPIYGPNAVDEDGNPIAVNQLEADPLLDCGDPRGACDAGDTAMQCSQGAAGRFSVVDDDGSDAPNHEDTSDGHGIAECQTATSVATGIAETVVYMDVPAECCPPVMHLCGLPLCPLRPNATLTGTGDANMIREMIVPGEDYEIAEDGTITPLCVPFLMPVSCCR